MDPTQHLSPHFTLGELIVSETATRRGLDNTPSPGIVENLTRLAGVLEQVRAAVGRPVVVTSGYRSLPVNRAVGSSDTSAHVLGLAADIHVPGMSTRDLAHAIMAARIPYDQLIDEKNWCHLGLAAGKQRGQVLTAMFTPGRATQYIVGIG